MDVREAVTVAKGYVNQLYFGEEIADVGLEEVEFDDVAAEWRVTIVFQRPWHQTSPFVNALSPSGRAAHRSYKVICIDDGTGEAKSLKDRILTAAE